MVMCVTALYSHVMVMCVTALYSHIMVMCLTALHMTLQNDAKRKFEQLKYKGEILSLFLISFTFKTVKLISCGIFH
jgi:hypothetical protein